MTKLYQPSLKKIHSTNLYKFQNVVEKKFNRDQLFNAKEVFLTSASSFVIPIIQIDNYKVNKSVVGNISLDLRKLYFDNFNNS